MAAAPEKSLVGAGRPRAASAVGARSISCRYLDRPVLGELSQPRSYPGPSAIATCSRDSVSVSARPATSSSERGGRAASTRASVSSTCWTLRWRSGPSPVTVPASTMDSTHEASSSSRLAGGVAARSEEHTSELQSHHDLVCRLLLEKKKKIIFNSRNIKNKKKQ